MTGLPPPAATTDHGVEDAGLFGWWRAADVEQRRALIAAALGWMLDLFDVGLYSLVLASLMTELGMAKTTAGLLGSITLAASAAGGLIFGLIADRYGRTKAMTASILIYSVFTGACGLADTVWQLALFRLLLGLGMGGEWATGAALVSETWPAKHRGKALGFVQSSAAFGHAAAALTTALVLPIWGWRAVFFVGVLPAFFTIWVRRNVKEPEIWLRAQAAPHAKARFRDIFSGATGRITIAVVLMNACTLFAFWGLEVWIPAYLTLPPERGGIGLSPYAMSALYIVMQVGKWFGFVTFGFAADVIGRKRTYVTYLVMAALSVVAYTTTHNPLILLMLGPLVAFFGTGYFSGFGAVTAELYPTSIRATAQGFTYNVGRLASAGAPFAVGAFADTHGFRAAFLVTAAAFAIAAVIWTWIPETKGKALS